jgi:hypothetical protein
MSCLAGVVAVMFWTLGERIQIRILTTPRTTVVMLVWVTTVGQYLLRSEWAAECKIDK